jgi:Xaa-Pro aminopeptidase
MVNQNRAYRLRKALGEAKLSGLICALPKNVLLLSGYWPVVGTGAAIAFDDGSVELVVPEDEKELAQQGWASRIHTFQPASLANLNASWQALVQPLAAAANDLSGKRIGIETGEDSEPATYAAMNLYQGCIAKTIENALTGAQIEAADDLIKSLRSVKSDIELDGIRRACYLTRMAFEEAVPELRPGISELEAAENFRYAFKKKQGLVTETGRAEAFFWAMSGANSAKAHGAFARSRPQKLAEGDLVLVHCNTCVDGYWTDITRTFSLGNGDKRRKEIYSAIFEGRRAALKAIAPGRSGAEIDHAARSVLQERGFGKEFKHSTGHGVGFGAISPNALPRIHPESDDKLQAGMVFNVEPAVYIEDYGGIRHCDMVAVTDKGYELLTDFYCRREDLYLNRALKGNAQSA